MRRHPIAFGLVLLLLIGALFFAAVYVMSRFGRDGRSFSAGDKVGIVTVDGIIRDARDTVEQIEDFGRDNRIKALVLRIDSPGGGVAPAQEIYEALLRIKKQKKIVVSMGSVAASGGYLIACAADKIVANPGTITGSISAVMHFANVEELMKKIGLKSSVVKSGKYKDIGSPVREMTAEERALMQSLVDDIYDQFLDVVSRDRKISREELKKIADGRIFSGRQARKMKLVDELGDLGHSVRLAGKLAGIPGTPETVYPEKKAVHLWEYLSQQVFSLLVSEVQKREAEMTGIQYLYVGR